MKYIIVSIESSTPVQGLDNFDLEFPDPESASNVAVQYFAKPTEYLIVPVSIREIHHLTVQVDELESELLNMRTEPTTKENN